MSDARQVTESLTDEEYLRRLFADPERAARSSVDDATALDFLDYVRWGGDVRCSHCGSRNHDELKQAQFAAKRRRRCRDCRLHFSTINKTPLAGLRIPARAIAIAIAHDEEPHELAARISREAQVSSVAALGFAFKMKQWRALIAEPVKVEPELEEAAAEPVTQLSAAPLPAAPQPEPAPAQVEPGQPAPVSSVVVEPDLPVAAQAHAMPVIEDPAQPAPDQTPAPRANERAPRREVIVLAAAIFFGAIVISAAAFTGLRQVGIANRANDAESVALDIPVVGSDRVTVAYWSHLGEPQSCATFREDHEPREEWSRRHLANVEALMQEFPPDR